MLPPGFSPPRNLKGGVMAKHGTSQKLPKLGHPSQGVRPWQDSEALESAKRAGRAGVITHNALNKSKSIGLKP